MAAGANGNVKINVDPLFTSLSTQIVPSCALIEFMTMFKPSPDGCSVALEVENFDDAVAQLKQHNVKFRIEPMATPACSMTMVYDPDGNCICIHKRKAK